MVMREGSEGSRGRAYLNCGESGLCWGREVWACGQAWKGFDTAGGEAPWEWAQQVQRP